jgi:hypothetical protein
VVTLEPRVDAKLKASANRLDVDETDGARRRLRPAPAAPAARGKPARRRASRPHQRRERQRRRVEVRQFASDVQVDGDAVTMSPLTFQLFGGRYQGRWRPSRQHAHATLRSRLLDLDVAQLAEFGNAKDTMTGTLTGAGTFTGSGRDFARGAGGRARRTARPRSPTARFAAWARAHDRRVLRQAGRRCAGASDAFDSIDLQFALQNQVFRADAMSLHSRDVDLVGSGTLATATKALSGRFDISLSEALSAQAGNDSPALHARRQPGRAAGQLGGTLEHPRVTIDAAAPSNAGCATRSAGA